MSEAKRINETFVMDAEENQTIVGKRATLCRCPKCGADHKMRLHWVGRGRPRKYCPHCRNAVNSVSGNIHFLDIHVH